MWLPAVARIYIPLVSIHLFCTLVQFLTLGFLLAWEPHHPRTSTRNNGKLLDLSNVSARRKWFGHWTFTFVWLVFHVIHDIYALVCESDFYQNPDETDLRIPQAFLFFYVLSLVFRTDDHVLAVPGLAEIAVNYHAQGIKNAQDESVTSYLLWSTSSLSSTVSVLFNAAMYFGFSDSCENLFACVYSWDHWYMTISCLSLLWYLCRLRTTCKNVVLAVFLAFLAIWTMAAPIIFSANIMRVTFICNMYYQTFVATLSLLLLHQHYSPD